METVDITSNEKEMLAHIGEALGFNTLKFDELYYAYRYIKAQGIASGTDVAEIANLGIPLVETLADLKNLPVDEIKKSLSSGSVTHEDVKNAFEQMTAEGGIFSIG